MLSRLEVNAVRNEVVTNVNAQESKVSTDRTGSASRVKVFYRGGCGNNAAVVRRKAPGSEVGLCDAPDASRVDDGWVLGADP